MTLGQKIKEFRKQKGINQQTLAEKVGCTQANISHVENGLRIHLHHDVLVNLARFFNVSVDYLLGNEPVKQNDEDLPLVAKRQLENYTEYLKWKYQKT